MNLSTYSVCTAWIVEAIGYIFSGDYDNTEAAQLLQYPEVF